MEEISLGGNLSASDAVLWVLDGNARARRFYESAGWRADGAAKTENRGAVVLREVRYRTVLGVSERAAPPRKTGVA